MSRPWMPLYIADYLADTSHMRALESGAYLHLIMHYWQHGGLPGADRQLAAIAKMSDEEWSNAKAMLAAMFQPGWRHKRIDKELAVAEQKYRRRAEAGRKGGVAKVRSNAEAMPVAMPPALPDHVRVDVKIGEACSDPPERKEAEIGDTRAREAAPMISPKAHALADECLRSIGIAPANEMAAPENLSGLRYQAQVWDARGHDPPTVVQVFMRLARQGKPLSYIAKAVDTAMAERAAAPVVEITRVNGASHAASRGSGKPNPAHVARRVAEEERARCAATERDIPPMRASGGG